MTARGGTISRADDRRHVTITRGIFTLSPSSYLSFPITYGFKYPENGRVIVITVVVVYGLYVRFAAVVNDVRVIYVHSATARVRMFARYPADLLGTAN